MAITESDRILGTLRCGSAAERLRALVSGGLVAALNVPIVQFGVRDFGFAVSQLARASAARGFRLQAKLRTAGNCGAVGNRSGNRAY